MNANLALEAIISDLPFTDQFKLTATKLNFKTLADILKVSSASLIKMPGFTYHFLQEFIQFAETNGIAGLLKD